MAYLSYSSIVLYKIRAYGTVSVVVALAIYLRPCQCPCHGDGHTLMRPPWHGPQLTLRESSAELAICGNGYNILKRVKWQNTLSPPGTSLLVTTWTALASLLTEVAAWKDGGSKNMLGVNLSSCGDALQMLKHHCTLLRSRPRSSACRRTNVAWSVFRCRIS